MVNSNDDLAAIKGGLIGFTLGLVVGAVAAMFLTTKTGEELRSDVKKIAFDLKEKVEEKASKVKNLTNKKYSEIVNTVVNNYNKVKELTEKEIDLLKNILIEQKNTK